MELPRGMKDFEETEAAGIERIRAHFRRLAGLYGFGFMDPSPIESLSVLETKSGPAIRDEIYHFTDKGDRSVALRFDFTVGLTRYIASQKSVRLPAKLASFGGVFRYDEPQRGRYRYFHQWDVEVYGRPTIQSDAEVIEITSRLFDAVSLRHITIDVNHRNLVESYIDMIFGSRDQKLVSDILRAIDKTQKKPRSEIIKEFQDRYDVIKLEKILDFSGTKGTIKEIEDAFDTAQLESWDELKLLFDSLKNRGVSNVRINFGIVRGLDYYTGMVFEVFDVKSKLGALAGGGRYDSLPGAFGRKDIGAAGAAGGVERMLLTMHEQDMQPEPAPKRIAILYVNDEMAAVAASITSMIRLAGIPADMDLAGRSLKKQMEHAKDARLAVIVGPDEISQGNVLLRDMSTGTEGTIPMETLAKDPKSALSLETP